ncbi:MAG TPA: hypothetical protein VES42_19255, partial [Pilimelia sp.]|nr:hypothetical protein [Pilimelia sp.]
APVDPADFPALVLHRRHDAFLVRGWAQLAGSHFAYSHLYFDLLHQVLRVLSTGRRSQRLRDVIAGQWGGDPQPPAFPKGSREIEALGPADRHRLFMLAARAMEGWPFRFVGACADAGIWWSWAMRDIPMASFAYADEVRAYLYRPFYKPSREEMAHARAYLERRRIKATKARLIPFLGDTKLLNDL